MGLQEEKMLAATHALSYVKSGMTLGLGSGSTASLMITALGKKLTHSFRVRGVPSSEKTAQLARKVGIPLVSLKEAGRLDLNIDGADEFNSSLQLIKGGGGALLREKILAHNADYNIIITDSSKQVAHLGAFKLPIETIPFATNVIITQLEKMGVQPQLRMYNSQPYRTDENNDIIDVTISKHTDVLDLEHKLISIPGVVETGFFLTSTNVIILAKEKDIVLFTK